MRAFYEEARRAIRHDLKDGLGADGGPTMAELELELEYVMEDAVVGWKGSGENDGALFAMRIWSLNMRSASIFACLRASAPSRASAARLRRST